MGCRLTVSLQYFEYSSNALCYKKGSNVLKPYKDQDKMSLSEKIITVKDQHGNEREVAALCASARSEPELDHGSSHMVHAVKLIFIDGHQVEVDAEGKFSHPDTRIEYSV